MKLQQQPSLVGGLLFLICFILFAMGASPTSGMGPGGVLTALLGTGGLPNPPGYPLIGLLTDLWLLLPYSDKIAHLNLFGAFQGALLCATLYVLVFKMRFSGETKQPASVTYLVPLVPVLLITQMPLFYRHFFFFERYLLPLQLFLMLLLSLHFSASQKPSGFRSFFIGILLTLLFWGHFFMFSGACAYFAIWWLTQRKAADIKVPAFVGGLAFGIFPVLWSVQKASSEPYFNWGDPRSFQNFLYLIRRADRGEIDLARSFDAVLRQLGRLQSVLMESFGWFGCLLVLGLLFAFFVERKNRLISQFRWSFLAVLSAVTLIPLVMINFSMGGFGSALEGQVFWITDNYTLPLLFCLCLIGSLGLGLLVDKIYLRSNMIAVLFSLSLLVVLSSFSVVEYRKQNSKDFQFTKQLTTFMNQQFPPGALVLTGIDSIYFPMMGQSLSDQKPSPIFIHTELLMRPWYLETLKRRSVVDESLFVEIDRYRGSLDSYMADQIDSNQMMDSYLRLVHQMIIFYEGKTGAYTIDFDSIFPMRYGIFGESTKEPVGFGDRLFIQNTEMKPILWNDQDKLLRQLVSPAEQKGPQKFWINYFQSTLKAQLHRRIKWTQGVEPEESKYLQALLQSVSP